MDEVLLVGGVVLLIAVPLAIVSALSWWLWRKGPYGRVTSVAIICAVVYSAGTAIWPTDSFYREEFADRTGIAFPPKARILFSDSSYPDFHGDYSVGVLFEVSSEEYEWLRKAAQAFPSPDGHEWMAPFQQEAQVAFGREFNVVRYGGIRTGGHGAWLLLDDGKSIYFWFAQT